MAWHAQSFNASLDRKAYFFVSVLTATAVTIGVMLKESVPLGKNLAAFEKKVGLGMKENEQGGAL